MIDLGSHYEVQRQLRGYPRFGESAMKQLSDAELLANLDPESNSVAILVRHLAGNMRPRFTDFLTTDGEKPDRNRDQEFDISGTPTRAESWNGGNKAGRESFATLAELKPGDRLRTVTHSRRAAHCASGHQSATGALFRACGSDHLSRQAFAFQPVENAEHPPRPLEGLQPDYDRGLPRREEGKAS